MIGLAVLPSRLKAELAALKDAILTGYDINGDPVLDKHAAWVDELLNKHTFTAYNADAIVSVKSSPRLQITLQYVIISAYSSG